MARSKAEVDLIVSQRAAAQAFQDLARNAEQAVTKIKNKLGEANEEAKKPQTPLDGWSVAIDRSIRSLQGFFALMQTGRGLVSFVRQELEGMARLQDESKGIEWQTEIVLQQLRNKLPSQREVREGKVSPEQFVSEREVESWVRTSFNRVAAAELVQTTISASLGTPRTAFEVAKEIAIRRPETLETGEAKELGGAIMDLVKVLEQTGEKFSPAGLIAMIGAVEKEARQTSTAQFASNGVQLMSVLMQSTNATLAEAGALTAALTQAGIDAEGAMARTSGVALFSQLQAELRSAGIFKDGRELNFGEMVDLFAGRGEFKDKHRKEVVEIAKKMGGLQLPGMSVEEVQEQRQIMLGKKRITEADKKGTFSGSKSHFRGLTMQLFVPPELAPDRDKLLVNRLFDDAIRVLPKDEAEARKFQEERPVRPVLQAQIAARQFQQSTSTAQMAVKAEVAELVERASVLSGDTAAIGKLRSLSKRIFDRTTPEVLVSGADTLRDIATDQQRGLNMAGRPPSPETAALIQQLRFTADKLELVANELRSQQPAEVQKVEVVNDRTRRPVVSEPPRAPLIGEGLGAGIGGF